MSWRAIAVNELRGARRERGAQLLFAGFAIAFGGLALLLVQFGDPDFEGYLDLLAAGMGLLIPLAGIVLGYETIIGERESGTAVLTLSMPHSRASMAVGKLVGRTVILVSVVIVTALTSSLAVLSVFPTFSAIHYAGFVLTTILYGSVFLWLSAALSMSLSTSRRVIAAAFGAYIGLTLSWNTIINIVQTVLFRFQSADDGDPERWVTFAKFIGPNTSYEYLLGAVFDIGTVPTTIADESAMFITPLGALLALLAWASIPVLAGYRSFRRSDL